jgi:hypothetical protein
MKDCDNSQDCDTCGRIKIFQMKITNSLYVLSLNSMCHKIIGDTAFMPKNLLHKTNAWVWYNKMYKHLQLTASCIAVKLNGTNGQCFNTWKTATRFRIKQELKFIYKKIRNFKNFTLHVQLCGIRTGKWSTEVLSCIKHMHQLARHMR